LIAFGIRKTDGRARRAVTTKAIRRDLIMRTWMVPIVTVSSLALLAACGETSTQRTTTGAVGGGAAGAVVGGPVGAVVGAGVGAVAGANREKIDEGTDKAADATKEKVADATAADGRKTTARSADRVAGPSNADVKQAQTALQGIGLYDGKIDGIYGSKTIKAVGEFQASNDLARTGTLNRPTQEKLQQASAAGATPNREPAQGTSSPAVAPKEESATPPAPQGDATPGQQPTPQRSQ
jgi:hypothetical protein